MYESFSMPNRQTVTFQDALDVVESLSEEQQKNLLDIIRRRLIERKRDVLAEHIKKQEKNIGEEKCITAQ